MFKLVRHFSVMAALAMSAITAILVYGHYVKDTGNLYRLADDYNTAQARTFANAIWSDYADFITRLPDLPPDALRRQPEIARLDADMRKLTRELPVLKVKVYKTDGLTVYSSDPKQIGESKSANAHFRRIAAAGIPSSKMSHRDVLNSFGENFQGRYVAETYVPIRDGNGGIGGLVELYTDISAAKAQVSRNAWLNILVISAALGTLYLMLLLVVRRANETLVNQYQQLEGLNVGIEQRVEQRTERLMSQQRALSALIMSETFREADMAEAFRWITRSCTEVLKVERASVWLFKPERDAIRCLDLYEAGTSRHSDGAELRVPDFPRYFEAILKEDHIVANNAHTDPRTADFSVPYLTPTGITSMLDAPIIYGGRVQGVLCIEHVGAPIEWAPEQVLFAVSIANLGMLVLERQERLRVQRQLMAAHQREEAASRAKSLFLANMSHEIRTPMNGVFGMVDLLLRTELSERQRKLTTTVAQSAKSLLTIINDILDFSRIEAGKLELDRHEYELRSAIEETVDLLANEAQRKELDLSLFVASDVPARIVGDAGRLRQVCTNIISNAIKFTSSGEVSVRVDCDTSSGTSPVVTIHVRDSGIGIPSEIQAKLFKPFAQADTSVTRRFGGTGLGLSISRHLIEMMGGTIALTSESGVGTEITIRLPVEVVAGAQTVKPAPRASLAGQRILVLDDRATNREIMRAYLRDDGAEVTTFAEAAPALAAIERAAAAGRPFHVAVIDMVLPGGNGMDFGRKIKARTYLADLKLLLVTSLSWKGDAHAARDAGFDTMLSKPVHRDELVGQVRRVLPSIALPASVMIVPPVTVEAATACYFAAHVLLAEDNPVNIEVAREYLTGLGCVVTVVENGNEAIAAFASQAFDLVFMDCHMPELDGLTATGLMRQWETGTRQPRTPIVALTANAYDEDRRSCLAVGMDDVLNKPCTQDQIQQMLVKWLKPRPAAEVAVPDAEQPEAAAAPVSSIEAAADEPGPLDLLEIERLRGANAGLFARLAETWLAYTPKLIAQLLQAQIDGNTKGLAAAAHGLYSSSANVGANRLALCAWDLESRFKKGKQTEPAECAELVNRIERESRLASDALSALLAADEQAAKVAKRRAAVA